MVEFYFMLLDNSKLNDGLNPNNELCTKWEKPPVTMLTWLFFLPSEKIYQGQLFICVKTAPNYKP